MSAEQEVSGDGDLCFHRENELWRVHIIEPEMLPDLFSVKYFKLKIGETISKLDYRILVDCITHFTNVESVSWNTGHAEWSPAYIEPWANEVLHEYDARVLDWGHCGRRRWTQRF